MTEQEQKIETIVKKTSSIPIIESLLPVIRDFLIIKRRQADLLLKFMPIWRGNNYRRGNNRPITVAEQKMYQIMLRLNHRGR